MKEELAEGEEGVTTPDSGGEERESWPEGVRLWCRLIVVVLVRNVVAVVRNVVLAIDGGR